MKIAFVGQKGLPAQTGGVERQVEELMIHLAERGHSVDAYARKGYAHDLAVYKGVRIIALPFIKGKNFEAISHTFLAVLHLWFRKLDVIHFQSIGPASLIWLVKILKPRTPIVFTFHCKDYQHKKWNTFAQWYLKFGENVGCRLADQTCVTSKELTAEANELYKGYPIKYVPSGINPPTLLEVSGIRRFGIDKKNYILYAGRLVRHKGVHYVINAFKRTDINKKLVIAGGGAYTDDYVDELKKLAAGDDRIIFVGNQSGSLLTELYSNAYLVVQPSEYEGLSMAILEAMSYGLPCLVSDIPSNLEATNGLGLTFRNRDENDLEAKLISADQNPELIAQQGLALKARTREEYDWNRIVDETLNIYQQVIAKQ
ncbi:glycosyl transferase family 1 [Candidatus Falkowbacteria bacterium HGW-Falkowbacteria-2]|uniref:Glycosyl transferase family 1 n=1 Tax=Candidatus Falkowbacteria bacterium HGW-Falkowbacteria-2 TaxID=2013769 RepID=A0A2N2E2N6_9BACT|nr:MAG: glycosyl transferase family 1 [Candidatus Falkowbacteria bacterium HGW-Falkowbacteria-2]